MDSSEIRKSFINFFKEREHTYVHSSPSVAPKDDPTLMFTNAGMNQFKDIFLGIDTPSYARAVNSQKCIRVSGKHNDLEEVGRDGTHHTFFEMLGNWSFGDYYKKEAISWAWELLTDVWEIDKDRLYATIFEEDDEAGELWKELTDIDPARILKLGAKDNFWEMGDTGPCGPCSEIHFDRGQQYACGDNCTGPDCECGRFVEIWNLVFIQFNRKTDGSLEPLEKKHVDTGMGFERIAAVLNGLSENYDTDLFQQIFDRITDLTGQDLNEETRTSFRVIADHVRMCTFAICDGAVPSNEGRGYVVRRVLRRAVRFANLLKEGAPILSELAVTVIERMGEFFTELKENPDYIIEVLRAEEAQFQRTLKQGNDLFEKITAGMAAGDTIEGNDVFTLYDTFGFPNDLVNLMAEEKSLQVDMAGFNQAMEEQKARSRAFARPNALLDQDLASSLTATVQDHDLLAQTSLEATVLAAGVSALAGKENNEYIITDTSNFYAEGGGQKGDAGTIKGDGFEFTVVDTQKEQGLIVHLGSYGQGSIADEGVKVTMTVDQELRDARRRNHTATHLLHHALREEFGTQVKQQGSMVDAERFTFDFTFSRKITDEEIEKIEDRVNALISDDLPVAFYEIALAEAKDAGIIALFDEKYGETVRVVDVGDGLSRELCGGTHAGNTGMIEHFKILVEESIAAGNRRIQGCTGAYVRSVLAAKTDLIEQAVDGLKEHNVACEGPVLGSGLMEDIRIAQKLIDAMVTAADSQEDMLLKKIESLAVQNESLRRDLGKSEAPAIEDLASAVQRLMNENKAWDREQRKQAQADAGDLVGAALEQAGEVKGITTVGLYLDEMDPKGLNDVLSRLQAGNPDGICVTASAAKGRATVLCAIGDGAADEGFDAVAIIKTIGKATGGGGGGKPNFARGGGGDPEKTRAALADLSNLLSE